MTRARTRVAALGLALAAVLNGGCAAALLGGAAAGGASAPGDGRSSASRADEQALSAAVRSRLAGAPALRAFELSVEAHGAAVTLRGEVDTAAQRALAARVAGGTVGVQSVRNELTVR